MNPFTGKPLPSFQLIGILAGLLVFLLFPVTASSQDLSEEPEPAFVLQGAVAFDPDYQLTENRRFIVFQIRNDGFRSISHLFGWVYRFREGPDGPTDFRLMNNPHQSAVLVEGGPHRVGSVAPWRFMLQNTDPAESGEKFTLRVSPRSVFYLEFEPPFPAAGNRNP